MKIIRTNNKTTQVDLLDISKATIQYARRTIVYGSTDLGNNNFPKEKRKALVKAVRDMRLEIWNKIASRMLRVKGDERILEFYSRVKIATKTSIGNCIEQAYLGLYFIYKNFPGVFAEACYLPEGDHDFIVINRKKGSLAANPNKWADTKSRCIVCDPWYNNSCESFDFYKVEKNYFSTEETQDLYSNHIQALNPKIHVMAPMIDTEYLAKWDSQHNLNKLFYEYKKKQGAIIKIIRELIGEFINIAIKNPQCVFIMNKLALLLQFEKRLYFLLNKPPIYKDGYIEVLDELEGRIKTSMFGLYSILRRDNNDRYQLYSRDDNRELVSQVNSILTKVGKNLSCVLKNNAAQRAYAKRRPLICVKAATITLKKPTMVANSFFKNRADTLSQHSQMLSLSFQSTPKGGRLNSQLNAQKC